MSRRFAVAWVLWLSVCRVAAGQSAAPSIEVFTDAQHPVHTRGHAGVQVYPVDAISRFLARVNSSLPRERSQGEAMALTVLNRGERHANALATSFEGLRRARRYDVDRVPAMVFDAKAIVYGLTDIQQALTIYRAWQQRVRQP